MESKKEPKGLAADISKSIGRLNMQMANWAMTLQGSYENARIYSHIKKSTKSASSPPNPSPELPKRSGCRSGRRRSLRRRAARSANLRSTERNAGTPRTPAHPPSPVLDRHRPLPPPPPSRSAKGKKFLRCRKNIHSELSSITEIGTRALYITNLSFIKLPPPHIPYNPPSIH
jgi:hypothetical protein